MYFKLVVVCVILNIFSIQGSIWFNPFMGPYGPGGPFASGGSNGVGSGFGTQKPNITGKPWGPYGPWGPWGPYGPGGPYGSSFGPARVKRGVFGMGLFGPYAGLHQQMTSSKFNWISSSVILKKQNAAIVMNLNDDLTVAKTRLESQLDEVNLAADHAALDAQNFERDIKHCISALKLASDKITAQIDALDIDAGETELAKNVSRNIGLQYAQIGNYGKAFKVCKSQFASPPIQVDDIQKCVADEKGSLDKQSDDIKTSINEDIITLQNQIAELIKNVSADVESSIQKASDEFNACNV